MTKLLIEITQNGERCRVVVLEDPRIAYCKLFNELHRDHGSGLRARIVDPTSETENQPTPDNPK